MQSTGEIGGTETSLLRFLAGVSETLVKPAVALLGRGPLEDELRRLGVDSYLINPGSRLREVSKFVSTVVQVARLARETKADVIYSNGTKSHFYGGPAAMLSRRPCVWHLSDMLERGSSWVYWLIARIPADVVIVSSNAIAAAARAFYARMPMMMTVYPGVPILEPDKVANLRDELGIASDSPLVGVVGRLQRWKGQLDLVEAAPQILAVHPKTHFVIVGGTLFGLEQTYPDELGRRAAELGLYGRVHLLGHRSDVFSILDELDVVVVPSRRPEGFGIIQIEAMAAGRPVVSATAGGGLEVVEDGITGIVIRPRCPVELATAICRLLSDPDLRAAMGKAGRQRVKERFSMENFVAGTVSAYESAISQGRSRSLVG